MGQFDLTYSKNESNSFKLTKKTLFKGFPEKKINEKKIIFIQFYTIYTTYHTIFIIGNPMISIFFIEPIHGIVS